jgi:Cell wall hydrolyses involved in spore germination
MAHRSKLVGVRAILPTILALLLICAALPAAAIAAEKTDAADGVTVVIDGEKAKLDDPVRMQDGRLFLPIANLATKLKASAQWDSDTESVTIRSARGDEIVLGNGVPVVYFNEARYLMDVPPFVADGRIYIPLRHVAELLHATVKWDSDAQVVELTSVKPAVVADEYGLAEIAEEFGVSRSALLKRNGLGKAEEAKEGTALKVIIPSIFDSEAEPYTEQDYKLLAKLVQVEVGYETYESQLAVANVVLNRVKDSRFPDSIRGVIYSGKQFPPAHNGLLDESKPNASVLRATKDALDGKNNVRDAVYFYNPKVTKGPFWSGLDTIVTIGGHRYAK